MIEFIGILIIVVGFGCRINTLLVVMIAGLATGIACGMPFHAILELFGQKFVENRNMTLAVILTAPVIGLMERNGLRERAEVLVRRARGATAGRIILFYCALRQITVALGISIGGQAGAVRPIVAPMAEGAAHTSHGPLPEKTRKTIRAHAAAADNVGNFFGEDIFIAVSGVLLMQSVLKGENIKVSIWELALWGIPTAIVAFGLMAWRTRALDRRISSEVNAAKEEQEESS